MVTDQVLQGHRTKCPVCGIPRLTSLYRRFAPHPVMAGPEYARPVGLLRRLFTLSPDLPEGVMRQRCHSCHAVWFYLPTQDEPPPFAINDERGRPIDTSLPFPLWLAKVEGQIDEL